MKEATLVEVLERITTKNNARFIALLAGHQPIIKHGGDQRDPTEEISCICKKTGYKIDSLPTDYFLHLYDLLNPYFEGALRNDGR